MAPDIARRVTKVRGGGPLIRRFAPPSPARGRRVRASASGVLGVKVEPLGGRFANLDSSARR